MTFRTQRKFRIDVEQNACASDVQLMMPWKLGVWCCDFSGGRFAEEGSVSSVGCFIHNELPLAIDCRLRTYPDRK
jgi:hypothetical protein